MKKRKKKTGRIGEGRSRKVYKSRAVIEEASINSLSEFVHRSLEQMAAWKKEAEDTNYAWFRGQSEDWELLPGIHRNREYYEWEETACIDYLIKNPDINLSNTPPWAIYSRMQHTAIKTRLLDWTTSPLIALFFALYDRCCETRNQNVASLGEHGVIWMMDPTQLNLAAYEQSLTYFPMDDFHCPTIC